MIIVLDKKVVGIDIVSEIEKNYQINDKNHMENQKIDRDIEEKVVNLIDFKLDQKIDISILENIVYPSYVRLEVQIGILLDFRKVEINIEDIPT